ncbi:hypothetical protein STAS_02053 [Striga asiatica]|uniref:Uncharacterized protein n=1 Tax=Striga asiatica TaxID=4170 RepID=A0A5A7P1F3_STRAF|nr:hypothetical protein STAS_02053 [Striga asiatica]
MAGKGQKRREKNYRAAHGGGNARLPPPPDPSSLDAVPSKLRKLMSLTGDGRQPFNRAKGNTVYGADKGINSGEGTESRNPGMKRKRSNSNSNATQSEKQGEFPQISESDKKKKKKRKIQKADDLRFEAADKQAVVGSRRKERKKQHLEAKKKKHKQSKSDEDIEFPGREEIKFGDIVQAPPKLLAVPKAFKTAQDASKERLRLQAVEAYRQRKSWASRPGVTLTQPENTASF